MRNYNNACTEVSVILSYLNKDEYNKIPVDVIEVIEENKSKDYLFKLDEGIELNKQKLLIETRAILFNLFRDYLATSEQKEKIIKMQREERRRLEEQKSLKYNVNDIFKKEMLNKNEDKVMEKESMVMIEAKKDVWYKRLFSIIKGLIKGKVT